MSETSFDRQHGGVDTGKFQETLDRLGVRVHNQTGTWTPEHLTTLVTGLTKVPTADLPVLAGVTMVRDVVHQAKGPLLGTEAEGHTFTDPVLDTDPHLAGPPHVHFFNLAFPLLPPALDAVALWGDQLPYRVVVHEIGHLVVAARVDPASAEFQATGRTMLQRHDAVVAAGKELSTAVSTGVSTGVVQELADGMCGRRVPAAYQAAQRLGVDCHALKYPGRADKDPNPDPKDRRQAVVKARATVCEVRKLYDELAAAAAAAKKNAAAVADTALATRCAAVVAKVQAFANAMEAFCRASIALAAAHRIVDCFVIRAKAESFGPPTDYARTAHDEMFAETYALAALRRSKLGTAPRLLAWFESNLTKIPQGLEDIDPAGKELHPSVVNKTWPGSLW
jgi:hypothetical protein